MITTRNNVKPIIMVESELMVVIVPRRIVPSTYMGRVSKPRPEVKKVIIKSSMDSVNASSAAAMMPGSIKGNFTFQKIAAGLAPKSMAASTSE